MRKIIEERLENAKLDLHNTVGRGLQGELKGKIMAYQDCLNLLEQFSIPKPQLNSVLRGTINEAKQKLDNTSFPPDTHDCFKRIGVVLNRFELDEILPAPRTEQEILKDFEALGYVIKSDYRYISLCYFGEKVITISKPNKSYVISQNVTLHMQEHKLLNELFTLWGWIF